MKVFLSHSTKDSGFVEKLAAAMKGNGFEPWLCEEDIESGANFVAEISRGLKESDLTLLVWSPDADNSVWTQQEWTSILKQEVEQSRIRLGVIMLRQHDLPPLLDTKNFIDARADHDTAIRRTLEWLEIRRKAQRFSGLNAPIYLPYRPEDFVGRSDYLNRLRNELGWQPRTFLLFGGPGTGKSTLALQFAWEAQKDFDAVIFQICGQRPLDVITAELVERLPIEVKTLPPDQQRKAAKDWLRQRQSLLILDDVWSNGDGEVEATQLEPGPACSVLYTSRLRSLSGITPKKQSGEVVKFNEAEAEELFHTYLDPVFGREQVDQHRRSLLDFASRVEMLPIAVAVGASWLAGREASGLGKAVLKLKLDKLADGSKDVGALFRTAIESQAEREQRLLEACASCAQEGFWLPLAAQITELSKDDFDDASDLLVRGSLLRVLDHDRKRFQLHALLREQVRARMGADSLAILQKRHAATVEELFRDGETRWRDCAECLGEILPAAECFHDQPEHDRAWNLAYRGYSAARRIGELDIALRIMQQEDRLADQRGDRGTLQASYGNQAVILRAWGRLDEALALHEKEEAICLELGNKDNLANSYGNQALILQTWGRLEEAFALLQKVEVVSLDLGDKDSLQKTYGNQALILNVWGRLEEALALHKKEEAICIELADKDGLQASYGNQALILKDRGRLEEALALHKKKEAICIELGNKNSLQISYGNQALILQAWGRLEEALALHKKEEAICIELGNKDSLQRSYGNQATILIQQKKLSEALLLYEKKEALCLELGNKSSLGYCYFQWARLEAARGDRTAQKQRLQRALAIFAELGMPRQRDAVQAELDELRSLVQ
jgi:tetratricopeptide (TPR) repeat protein